jgi:L-alanine-DL-glutamate epimerase-like enolase superfamily enzyme
MKQHFRRSDLRLAHNWMVASSQRSGGKSVYPAVLVELRDKNGVIGYGEAAPSLRYRETAQTCVEFLSRVDAGRLASRMSLEACVRWNLSPEETSHRRAR